MSKSLGALNFKPLSEADRGELKRYLGDNPSRICETTYGVILLWDVKSDGLYCIDDGTLYLCSVKDGKASFNFPLGGDGDVALERIRDFCRENGYRLHFRFLSYEQRAKVASFFGAESETDRDWADYLYYAEDVRTLSGKRYHGQKNFLNRFLKTYPDYSFVEYDENLKDAAMKFYEEFYSEENKESGLFFEEKKVFLRLLNEFSEVGQLGSALMVGGKIVAMSFGEVVGDTLYVHFEKALREYHGSYAAINYLFANRYGADAKYINREEDVGDEGLRTAKLSLHPVMLIDKFFADVEL